VPGTVAAQPLTIDWIAGAPLEKRNSSSSSV
jgi:hypothetical protein